MDYAIIKNDIVTHIIVADNVNTVKSVFSDYDGIVELTESTFCQVGATLVGDRFKPPAPFESWTWNETEWRWEAPIKLPTDGKPYRWNEETQTWDEIMGDTI